MKNIRINVININKFYLKIYDSNCNIIFDNYMCNGNNVLLEKNKFYKINIISNNTSYTTAIYVSDKTNSFTFGINRIVTFLLKDFYYDKPIEKGEIILWQK